MNRWITYQKERFPLLAHAPLVLAFSASAVSYSAFLRGLEPLPGAGSYLTAFAVSLISFFLLRVADEFKDAEEDARYRPYRPVPRGLVKLSELAWIGVGLALVQIGLTAWLTFGNTSAPTASPDLRLFGLLLVTWTYFALMSREFFVEKWLRERPVIYLFSHMMIMPLVDWFATGCDWAVSGQVMPPGLFWFLAASFCNGIVIEIGRKIRSPEQEENGVPTYTALWGRPVAVASWLSALAATLLCAVMAAREISFVTPVAVVLALLLSGSLVLAFFFLRRAGGKLAKSFEAASGIWTLALYLSLGVLPLVLRLISTRA